MADYVAVLGWPRLDQPSLRPTDAGVRDPDSFERRRKAFELVCDLARFYYPLFFFALLFSVFLATMLLFDIGKTLEAYPHGFGQKLKTCVDHVTFTLTLAIAGQLLHTKTREWSSVSSATSKHFLKRKHFTRQTFRYQEHTGTLLTPRVDLRTTE